MSLTLSTATAQVRLALNEPTAVFWSDTEIEYWIKEGVREFSIKSLLVEDTQDLTLVANQISYTASDHAWIATMIEPYSALYYYGAAPPSYKGLIKSHPRMLGNEATNTAGDPKMYCLHDKTIYLWPPPSAGVAGRAIKFLFAKETEDIADVIDEYQQIPLYYALAKCKYKDKMFAEGNAYMSIFTSSTAFERGDKHGREQDTLDMFKIKPRGGERGAG